MNLYLLETLRVYIYIYIYIYLYIEHKTILISYKTFKILVKYTLKKCDLYETEQ